jgi:hypothetical protein
MIFSAFSGGTRMVAVGIGGIVSVVTGVDGSDGDVVGAVVAELGGVRVGAAEVVVGTVGSIKVGVGDCSVVVGGSVVVSKLSEDEGILLDGSGRQPAAWAAISTIASAIRLNLVIIRNILPL